jgi:hypothetical protein
MQHADLEDDDEMFEEETDEVSNLVFLVANIVGSYPVSCCLLTVLVAVTACMAQQLTPTALCQADFTALQLTMELPFVIKQRIDMMADTAVHRKQLELYYSLPMLQACAQRCKTAKSSEYFVPVRLGLGLCRCCFCKQGSRRIHLA